MRSDEISDDEQFVVLEHRTVRFFCLLCVRIIFVVVSAVDVLPVNASGWVDDRVRSDEISDDAEPFSPKFV